MLAAGGDPGRLRVTLSSVRDQPSPAIEIIVVSYDGGEPTAKAAAGDDTRARFFNASGVEQARTLGIRHSRAKHVLIASPGDVYSPGVLVELIDGIQPDRVFYLTAGFMVRRPFTLAEIPNAATNPNLGRLLMPRWRAAAALMHLSDPDPDGFLIALHVLRDGFRPSGWDCYRDARRDPTGPFAARLDPFPGLAARIARDRASLDVIADVDNAQAVRARGALVGLRPYLEVVDTATDAQWASLVEHAAYLQGLVDPLLPSVDVVANALAVLAAGGHRDEVLALAGYEGNDFPTTIRDGRVIAELPVPDGLLVDDDLEVSWAESAAKARVRRLTLDGSIVRLELLVGVHNLIQAESDTVVVELHGGDDEVHPMRVRLSSDPAVTRWMADREHDHDAGLVQAELDLRNLTSAVYVIYLVWSDGELERVVLVGELASNGSAGRAPIALPDGRFVGLHLKSGRVGLAITAAQEAPGAVVNRVEVDGDQLRLTLDRAIDRVWLEGGGRRVAAVPGTAGFWTVPLVASPWALGEAPLPTGTYRLVLEREGTAVPAVAAAGVVDLLPHDVRTSQHRLQLQRGNGDRVVVRLDPLLGDDELGPRAQRVLQQEFGGSEPPLDPRLVYFQSFTGQSANDNPLAIQAELHRRRGDLDIRWVVADSSSTVPDGATPLLFRSREWYDVMTRASYLVTNIELEKWFARRPGQQILQTFHGYPSKAMGLGLWRPRGLTPRQIESQLDHTSRVWNNLVTPAQEMDQYYRRDYAYDGTILPLGYPRNDVLVGERSEELRVATRERLGIRADQHAILYAPTWRDDLATNFRSAEAVHHLDVARAAARLGDQYVLLLRGHRFHAPSTSSGGQVIDVTSYPDVNHLIAASDAAVLDYSSLRFDFALTGRPMVFLVPDLETYGSRTRGFLWDYRETAPGPLVSSTAEVVTMLRDLEGLSTRFAADLVAFNARYNALHDGRAAERVVSEFFAPLLGA